MIFVHVNDVSYHGDDDDKDMLIQVLCLHLHICIHDDRERKRSLPWVGTLRPPLLGCDLLWRQPPHIGVSGCRRASTQAIPVYAMK